MDQKYCLDLTRMCTQQSTSAKEIWAANNPHSRSSMEKRLMKCRPCTCKGYRHLSHPQLSTGGSWFWWAIRRSIEGSTFFSFSFLHFLRCVKQSLLMALDQITPIRQILLEILHTDDKKAFGREGGKEIWSIFNSRKPLFNSRKIFREAGGSRNVGPPRGCWTHHYSFRVLFIVPHKKDTPLCALDSLPDPTHPPAAVPSVESLEKHGARVCWVQQHTWSCSEEVARCSSWLGFLGKATFLPLACPHKASPQHGQQALVHMSTGTPADPPKDAPSLSVPRNCF